jgi:hypothetical protein
LTAFKSFGQTVINNDSLVFTNKSIAIKITKDLVRKDFLEKKVKLLEIDTFNLAQLVCEQNRVIDLANKKEQQYKNIIAKREEINTSLNDYITAQNKQFAKYKTKTIISQIVMGALLIFTITKL